jgi:hypothetical protein
MGKNPFAGNKAPPFGKKAAAPAKGKKCPTCGKMPCQCKAMAKGGKVKC